MHSFAKHCNYVKGKCSFSTYALHWEALCWWNKRPVALLWNTQDLLNSDRLWRLCVVKISGLHSIDPRCPLALRFRRLLFARSFFSVRFDMYWLSWDHLWAVLTLLMVLGYLEPSWCHVGALLVSSWAHPGAPCSIMGPSCPQGCFILASYWSASFALKDEARHLLNTDLCRGS